MKTNFLFIFFAFILQSSHAIDRTAVTLLKADFAAFTRPTNRELHIFNQRSSRHLTLREEDWANPKNETSLKFLEGLQEISKEADGGGMVGPGLYAAPDSYSSGSYTDLWHLPLDNWITHRIKIPKDTTILDLRSDSAREGFWFPVSDKTTEYLSQYCPEFKYRARRVKQRAIADRERREAVSYKRDYRRSVNGTSYNYFSQQDLAENPICLEIYKTVMKELGVGMIAYGWAGSHPQECDAEAGYGRNSESAFLIMDMKLDKENVDTFTSVMPTNMSKEALDDYRNIHYMTLRNANPGNKTTSVYGSAYSVWKDQFGELGETRDANSLHEKYMFEHKFGCSRKYEQDDSFQHFPEKTLTVLLEEFGTSDIAEIDLKPCPEKVPN